ncbi:hypothetical protein FA95DRAFT_1529975 [Auriscalpium vulgare]|uniref:Uncharacterized protein n=1 Tax=Auriscalpium vulgare TaxID=40419 RepID=A0ACB8SDP1_9AGAM|nr:hypothetical protein FA95DRAFT_1529975 [Auriscalpium vulgare]
MAYRIVLWDSKTCQLTDDAGTVILSSTGPPPVYNNPGLYEDVASNAPLRYVPPLQFICLKALIEYPEDVHFIGRPRIAYQPPASSADFDMLRALLPSYDPISAQNAFPEGLDLSQLDPRLWANLIQVYIGLPDSVRVYHIALSDNHLPLLQRVPATTDFSLVTVLDLKGCTQLTDDTILKLKPLHGLTAFDASGTRLTANGLRRFACTLDWSDDEVDNIAKRRRGPWQLRILRLRNCRGIGNSVFSQLDHFPLLSVVDLRGTSCVADRQRTFHAASDARFYHPAPLLEALSALSASPTIFSSQNPYVLHIDRLHYGSSISMHHAGRVHRPSVAPEDTFVMIPSSGSAHPGHVVVGNSSKITREQAEHDEAVKYEANKAAWYERNPQARERPEDFHYELSGSGNLDEDGCGADSYYDGMDTDSSEYGPNASTGRQRSTPTTKMLSGRSAMIRKDQRPLQPQLVTATGRSATRARPQGISHQHPRQGQPVASGSRGGPAARRPTHQSSLVAETTTEIRRRAWTMHSSDSRNPRRSGGISGGVTSRPAARPPPAIQAVAPASALPTGHLHISPANLAQIQTPALHSLPSVIASADPPGLAQMNAVASEEVSAARSRLAAQAFYARPPHERQPIASTQDAPIPTARSPLHSLMLYRDPPPWSLMNLPPSHEAGITRAANGDGAPASVNRHDQNARKQVAAITNMMTERKRTSMREADGFQQSAPVRTSTSRNPFARLPNDQKPVLMKAIKEKLGVASIPIGASETGGEGLPPPKSLKPLKPIMSLDVPQFPKLTGEMKTALRRSGSLESARPPKRPNAHEDVARASAQSPFGQGAAANGRQRSVTDGTAKKLKLADSAILRKTAAKPASGPKQAKKPSLTKAAKGSTAEQKGSDLRQWLQ